MIIIALLFLLNNHYHVVNLEDALIEAEEVLDAIYTIDLSAKDDFAFEKGLDVFENEPLLHYIKFGRHLAGASSNVIKRVLKNADFYRFDGKNILSRNIKDGVWKIVPEPSKRFDFHLSVLHFFEIDLSFQTIDQMDFIIKVNK